MATLVQLALRTGNADQVILLVRSACLPACLRVGHRLDTVLSQDGPLQLCLVAQVLGSSQHPEHHRTLQQ